MLDVVTGPFHPGLETEFVRRLREAKRDPVAPLIIVAPSRRLAARLRELALEAFPRGIAGLHIHNLYSFARELQRTEPGWSVVEDDLFHEKLLSRIIGRDFRDAVYLPRALHADGSARAILGAIKDLRDGGVDPQAASALLAEGGLGGKRPRKVSELLELHGRYLAELGTRKILGRADVVAGAAGHVDRIAGVPVFYYGFYELVQTQIDLFRAVVRECPVTLFYPFVPDDLAFEFARDFYDTIVRGMAASETRLARGKPVAPRRQDCSGARDEAWACAKWILERRDEGIPFHGIGVVARTLDPYADAIDSVFREHAIPYVTSATRASDRDPWFAAVLGLLDLAADDFPRDRLMEVVASPYFLRGEGDDPFQWDLATRHLGIGRGRDEWKRRLEPLRGKEFVRSRGRDGRDRAFVMEAAQVDRFAATLLRLLDRAVPPAKARWSDRCAWARSLVADFLKPGADLDELLGPPAALDAILPPPSSAEFRDTLRIRLGRMERPAGADNIRGVQVLDAMAARGLPFEALAVLGMNERVFPRYILEDPFIPDDVRLQFSHRLGNRLPLKVRGYDEERLLFALLEDAASKHRLLLHQRSDERGRVQVPSMLLGGEIHGTSIPRQPAKKLEAVPPLLLTPREAMLRAGLRGGGGLAAAKALSGLISIDPAELGRSLEMLSTLEKSKDAGSHDGAVGALPEHKAAVAKRGFSPTALRTFVVCPFKYFAEKLLHLEPLDEPEGDEETDPLHTGTLYHAVLKDHLEGQPLEKALQSAFAAFEKERAIRYPLVWEAERRRIRAVLEGFLAWEAAERGGFKPRFFEQQVGGIIDGVRFGGFVDRIDLGDGAFRVIEYKSSKSGAYSSTMDTGVFKTGRYVQPPLYFHLAAELLKAGGIPFDPLRSSAGFLFIDPRHDGAKKRDLWLDGADFAPRSGEWRTWLKRTVDAVDAGDFVLRTGDECRYCEMKTVCRKAHVPTKLRSERFHGGEA